MEKIDTDIRRKLQLGMPFGTASNRLKKQIMFNLIVEAGRNSCHKCGFPMTANTLSIEHIEPWENRDASLFWDYNNIAFSHKDCNRPHEYNRKDENDATAWCTWCKQFKLKEDFSKHGKRWNGLQPICNECRPLSRKSRRDRPGWKPRHD